MPERSLRVQLVRHTDTPQELVALGARLCYAGGTLDSLVEKISGSDQEAFVQKVMGMGHDSVLEHASFTFLVEGVSRVLLAQLTRHRIASFSVQSQRYVNMSDARALLPDSIDNDEGALGMYGFAVEAAFNTYNNLIELGIPKEDARMVLPEATFTKILFTMNARELKHFFSLRMCNRAQWEIRDMANAMYRQVIDVAPVIFKNAGPGCWRGACPEKKPCGNPPERVKVGGKDK